MSPSEYVHDYTDLAALLHTLGALPSATEVQGFATGLLAVGADVPDHDWLGAAAEFCDYRVNPDREQSARLVTVLSTARERLNAEQMDYALLLPNDDTPLALRVEALSQWCIGFLNGFARAGHQRRRPFSPEVDEAVGDIANIARIETPTADDEASEQDLFEIAEYLRVAAITIYLDNGGLETLDERPVGPRPAVH